MPILLKTRGCQDIKFRTVLAQYLNGLPAEPHCSRPQPGNVHNGRKSPTNKSSQDSQDNTRRQTGGERIVEPDLVCSFIRERFLDVSTLVELYKFATYKCRYRRAFIEPWKDL